MTKYLRIPSCTVLGSPPHIWLNIRTFPHILEALPHIWLNIRSFPQILGSPSSYMTNIRAFPHILGNLFSYMTKYSRTPSYTVWGSPPHKWLHSKYSRISSYTVLGSPSSYMTKYSRISSDIMKSFLIYIVRYTGIQEFPNLNRSLEPDV